MRSSRALLSLALLLVPVALPAQEFTTADPVIQRIWTEGTSNGQVGRLGQVLMDSIGPRLAGTPGMKSARDWVERTYTGWGIPVRQEKYATWRGWEHGLVHLDLVAPRRQSLVAHLLAWSAPAPKPVEGLVVAIPAMTTREEFDRWLPSAKGKFVLLAPAELTCRAKQELEQFALPSTVAWVDSVRKAETAAFSAGLAPFRGGQGFGELVRALDGAGVAGILTSRWSGGWGATRVFSMETERAVALDVSCEDFGLLSRLAAHGQGPKVRVMAEARDRGTVDEFNVIAELRGSELPDEYVLLSAHLDSWHGATGATDNGTGTVMMLEAMRLLKAAYPNPKRTILVGHWGAEEQGLVGSGAFAEDHPEVVQGLQAGFNHDNGTWHVELVQAFGFLDGIDNLARWLARLPRAATGNLEMPVPGELINSGSDHYSFLCRGAPAFRLTSAYDEYRQYTWHTTLDTYDKVMVPEVQGNAILVAMLAYQASEDPERVGREPRAMLPNGQGPETELRCRPTRRSWEDRR